MGTLSSDGEAFAVNTFVASGVYSRLIGLSWRKKWMRIEGREADGIIFPCCAAIHTFFMFMTIDVIFLDKENRVVKCVAEVKPWRIALGGIAACTVIELPGGTLQQHRIQRGCVITFE